MTETRQRDALDALLREWPEPPGDRFDADEMADRVAEAAFAAVVDDVGGPLGRRIVRRSPLDRRTKSVITRRAPGDARSRGRRGG